MDIFKREELRVETVACLAKYLNKSFKEAESALDEMTKQLKEPDSVQVQLQKKMEKERFLGRVNQLYFKESYTAKDAVEKAKEEIAIDEKDADEVLETILKVQAVV